MRNKYSIFYCLFWGVIREGVICMSNIKMKNFVFAFIRFFKQNKKVVMRKLCRVSILYN